MVQIAKQRDSFRDVHTTDIYERAFKHFGPEMLSHCQICRFCPKSLQPLIHAQNHMVVEPFSFHLLALHCIKSEIKQLHKPHFHRPFHHKCQNIRMCEARSFHMHDSTLRPITKPTNNSKTTTYHIVYL